MMPVDKNHLHIFQRYLLAYNSFDVNGMLEMLSDEVNFANYSNGVMTASASNKCEFKELANKGKWIFDERKQEIVSMRPLENGLEAKIRFLGKLSDEVAKEVHSGHYVEIYGTSKVEFRDRKIVRLVDRS